MQNDGATCVVQPWVWGLSWKQQTTLLCALRGCDSVGKNDPTKNFIRGVRRAVLHNADESGNSDFMLADFCNGDIYRFTKDIDRYPVHFLLHLVHAAEIIGYFHPNEACREIWNEFYLELVNAFHMRPESKEENIQRLRDGVDTCCHKT